jgi:hypothetical protein
MADAQRITSTFASHVRQVAFRLWGGIGSRVSFYMMVALILAAALVGAFFFWEGKKTLDAEIRGRTLYVARELAALAADDVITGNRFELSKKLPPLFTAHEDALSGSALLYLMIYNHTCDLLIGSTATEVFFNSGYYYYKMPPENITELGDVVLSCDPVQTREPLFTLKKNGVMILRSPCWPEGSGLVSSESACRANGTKKFFSAS